MNRLLAFLCVVPALLLSPAAGAAEVCPQKVVRLLVGFPPGGATDILARLMSQALTAYFKRGFLVDNRPGATGNIAAEAVAKARPDGCTYLVVSAAFASNVSLSSRSGYDPLRQFAPVARIAAVHNVLVVHPSVPVTDVASFIAFAKGRPGEVVFGTAGSGSTSHLAVELLRTRVGALNVIQVPYKGLGPAVLDIVAGEVDALFGTTPPLTPHIRSGRLRALAVANPRRAAALPDVPTFEEAGYPGFEAAAWNGIVAPAGTPYESIVRVNLAVAEIVRSPEMRERFATQGAEPIGDTPDEFRNYLRSEVEKWSKVVKATGAKIE